MSYQTGDRVRVRESDGVCQYLWGHVGTVEEIKPVDLLATGQFVVAFDDPLPQATEHWTPMVTCAFSAAQLESV
jgi:hypothetical protein